MKFSVVDLWCMKLTQNYTKKRKGIWRKKDEMGIFVTGCRGKRCGLWGRRSTTFCVWTSRKRARFTLLFPSVDCAQVQAKFVHVKHKGWGRAFNAWKKCGGNSITCTHERAAKVSRSYLNPTKLRFGLRTNDFLVRCNALHSRTATFVRSQIRYLHLSKLALTVGNYYKWSMYLEHKWFNYGRR